MDFRKYYGRRLFYAFHYSKKNIEYRIIKTLCLIVGIILAIPLFVVEMAITLVYMLLMWIPIINSAMLFVCRILTGICGLGFYIAIGPDIPQYVEACEQDLKADDLAQILEQAEEQPVDEDYTVEVQSADQEDDHQDNTEQSKDDNASAVVVEE